MKEESKGIFGGVLKKAAKNAGGMVSGGLSSGVGMVSGLNPFANKSVEKQDSVQEKAVPQSSMATQPL